MTEKPKTDALIHVICHDEKLSHVFLEMVMEAVLENYELGIKTGMDIANNQR